MKLDNRKKTLNIKKKNSYQKLHKAMYFFIN